MLQASLKAYKKALEVIPSLGSIASGFPRELKNAAEALRLGVRVDVIRGKALFLGILTALPPAFLYFATRDFATLFLLFLIPLTVYVGFLLIPVALFRIEKARLVADSLTFVISFSILLQHMNQEEAFRRSIKNLHSGIFIEAWIRLRLGELCSVSDALLYLAERARAYSEQLYTVFRSAASEVLEAEPNYRALLRDSLSAIQVENSIELSRFAERFRIASAVVSFMPVSLFLALPFLSAFTKQNVNAAFIVAAIGVVVLTSLSILFLSASYPSSARFADLSKVDTEAARLLGVKPRSLPTRAFIAAFAMLFLLSIFSPAFLLLLGALFLIFSAGNAHIPKFVEGVKRETANLPLELKEISYRLRRGEPLERALSASKSITLKAIRHRATGRLFPEGMFHLLEEVVKSLRHSGEGLALALEELRVYLRELLNYRSSVEAQLENARAYLFLLYILLPILSLFSLWAFDFIARVSQMDGEAYLGFEGFSLVSSPPDLKILLAFISPALLVSMCLLIMLSVLCEDVVAPQLLKAKTWMLGVGTLILGTGELILIT